METLGHYQLEEMIGRGGMGEVWRARDLRLDRTVAVKILPDHLAADPAFLQRFEREARIVAQLHHPHICALFDVGEAAGRRFLVMELLDGQTLQARLTAGPLPLDELYRTAEQLADALDRAHRQGVVHRDLKPGNVFLTRDGVKLLDFGLARPAVPDSPPPIGSVEQTVVSPTDTADLTRPGSFVGTLRYMAPEQLEGHETDARSDIFAFGLLLHEMATGQQAFAGDSQASIIAATMKEPLPRLDLVAPLSPPGLQRLVDDCTAKDPDDRCQSMHDVRQWLSWLREGGSQAGLAGPLVSRRRRSSRLAWILVVALALACAGLATRVRPGGEPAASPAVVHAALRLPEGATLNLNPYLPGNPAVSPDGRRVVYGVATAEDGLVLCLQDLEAAEPRLLPGTSDSGYPFWSPDGRRVGFFGGNSLKVIDLESDHVETLAEAPFGKGGTWSRDGTILYAPSFASGLLAVPASGGEPLVVIPEDSLAFSCRFPCFLPDGRRFVYVRFGAEGGVSELMLADLDGGAPRSLGPTDSQPRFADGQLLYVVDNGLRGRTIDLDRGVFTGSVATVLTSVARIPGAGVGLFAVGGGTLVHLEADVHADGADLTLIDRRGETLQELAGFDQIFSVALSPDGARALVAATAPGDRQSSLFLYELPASRSTRLTFDEGAAMMGLWHPDGDRVVYTRILPGEARLEELDLVGTEPPRMLVRHDRTVFATGFLPDGSSLLYAAMNDGGDIDMFALNRDGEVDELIVSGRDEWNGSVSPDGRWLLYELADDGRSTVMLTTWPPGGRRWEVSLAGGRAPCWRQDGREIYFLDLAQEIVAVAVDLSDGAPRFEPPQTLFALGSQAEDFDTRDGRSFLVGCGFEQALGRGYDLVLNWPRLLQNTR